MCRDDALAKESTRHHRTPGSDELALPGVEFFTRNFYKVEKWTRDGMKVDSLFYAGNNLDKRETFLQGDKAAAVTPYVLRSVRISDAAANLSVLSAG